MRIAADESSITGLHFANSYSSIRECTRRRGGRDWKKQAWWLVDRKSSSWASVSIGIMGQTYRPTIKILGNELET